MAGLGLALLGVPIGWQRGMASRKPQEARCEAIERRKALGGRSRANVALRATWAFWCSPGSILFI